VDASACAHDVTAGDRRSLVNATHDHVSHNLYIESPRLRTELLQLAYVLSQRWNTCMCFVGMMLVMLARHISEIATTPGSSTMNRSAK